MHSSDGGKRREYMQKMLQTHCLVIRQMQLRSLQSPLRHVFSDCKNSNLYQPVLILNGTDTRLNRPCIVFWDHIITGTYPSAFLIKSDNCIHIPYSGTDNRFLPSSKDLCYSAHTDRKPLHTHCLPHHEEAFREQIRE